MERGTHAQPVGVREFLERLVGLVLCEVGPPAGGFAEAFHLFYRCAYEAHAIFGGAQRQLGGEEHDAVEWHSGMAEASPADLYAASVGFGDVVEGLGGVDGAGAVAVFA